MNNFKRHIYKTKNPPKPPKSPIGRDWFISRGETSFNSYCYHIDTQVWKDPATYPVQIGDTIYQDEQQTSPFTPGSTDTMYSINPYPTQTPEELGEVTVIHLSLEGVVTDVGTGKCSPVIPINVSSLTKGPNCKTTDYTTVFIRSSSIENGIIKNSSQLYKDSDGLIELSDPEGVLGGTFGGDDHVGVNIDSSVQPPTQTLEISTDGRISNSVEC